MLETLQAPLTAAVIGASGGIGGALVDHLAASDRVRHVHALSRSPLPTRDRVSWTHCDFDAPETIERAAGNLASGEPLDLVIVAAGLLHGNGIGPEKDWRQLDGGTMARLFQVNTIGPALVAAALLPAMRRDRRSVLALLSARVGSIADNRLGGWYGYRASKAALNMIVRNFAIELERKRLPTLAVALHPGTVDTALSQPFQANTRPGQVVSPADAARHLLTVIDGLTDEDNGRLIAWNGERLPY